MDDLDDQLRDHAHDYAGSDVCRHPGCYRPRPDWLAPQDASAAAGRGVLERVPGSWLLWLCCGLVLAAVAALPTVRGGMSEPQAPAGWSINSDGDLVDPAGQVQVRDVDGR